MKTAKISIVGFGSIGVGLATEIAKKKDFLKIKGYDLKVVTIVDADGAEIDEDGLNIKSIIEKRERGEDFSYAKGALDLIGEIDQDILVECTPSNIRNGNPGLNHILASLRNGVNVVTSNKGPLVVDYKRIMETAKKNNVSIGYEATVGGAIPLINLVKGNLRADDIVAIKGILNGTSNYILTKMHAEKRDYEEILLEAKELGIAETDASYDVEGIDTASKLVILANSLMGMDVKYEDVEVEGITRITPESLDLADELGCTIKLIGEVEREGKRLKVSPKLVPYDHPLSVGGTLNIVLIKTDVAGEVTISGKGAGPKETSSALLSDILNIVDERC